MTLTLAPLTPNAPLTYWQVTPLSQARYDVPDSPMQGEMDSTFFLTKDKNWIPHTYPCRTAYIAEVRGREPADRPRPDWRGARNILPTGSDFLDLSGFWFRPTRIEGWARSAIRAEAAGTARLALTICGAAKAMPICRRITVISISRWRPAPSRASTLRAPVASVKSK